MGKFVSEIVHRDVTLNKMKSFSFFALAFSCLFVAAVNTSAIRRNINNNLIIYKDIINGNEILSNRYPSQLIDNFIWEVEGTYVDGADIDQELVPCLVTVEREKRMVEVENRELHRICLV